MIKKTVRIIDEDKELLTETNKTVKEKEETIQLLQKEINTLTETRKSIAYDN